MPANSLIVGVDLAPIKSIPKAITFQSDITTDKCRATIRQHFKTWKADTVLHDGAPNVGTAWVQDAFSQAELALQALKLATEFLIEGGTFVTKVFRSKDYNALLWVFNQLFAKVEATKPPSSRNVSAEIFVVCRGFKAPKRIDPKFLDPRSVFAELSDPTPNNEAKVFNPEKKKRKRDGYGEGDYTQFKEVSAREFIQTTDPIAMLGSLNKLSFDQRSDGDIALAALNILPETTPEIRQCCLDLKVLGRKEFRSLLRWRLKVREKLGLATKKPSDKVEGEEVTEVVPMDEELQIQGELQKLYDNENSRKKRERRRENEKKQKEIIRMQMHMMPPTEIGLEQAGPNGEDSMFALRTVEKSGACEKISRGKMGIHVEIHDADGNRSDSIENSDEEEDGLDTEMDTLYLQYQERRSESDAKYRAKKARTEHNDADWEGFSANEDVSSEEFQEDQDTEQSSAEEEEHGARSIIHRFTERGDGTNGLTKRAAMFFEQDIFKSIGGLEAEGSDSAIDVDADNMTDEAGNPIAVDYLGTKDYSVAQEIEVLPQLQTNGSVLTTRAKEFSKNGKVRTNSDADVKSSFEVVKGIRGSDWEMQGEPLKNGRLGVSCFMT